MNTAIIRLSAATTLSLAAFVATIGPADARGTAIGGAIGGWANDGDESTATFLTFELAATGDPAQSSGPTLTTRCVVPGTNKTVRC